MEMLQFTYINVFDILYIDGIVVYFCVDGTGVWVDGIHCFAPQILVLCLTIRTCATPHHLIIWISVVR